MCERIPFNAHTLERILREGDVTRALGLGWGGTFKLHRLVKAGVGGRAVLLSKSWGNLGLDLTDELGVATVRSIRRDGAAAASGQVRPGDVVRSVDGQVYFTCEAVVEALRSHRRGDLTLGILRLDVPDAAPAAPSTSWSDSGSVRVRAGATHLVTIEATAPAVLQYEFRSAACDVGFRVSFIGELGDAAPSGADGRGRGLLIDLRGLQHSGHVALPNAGRYAATLDNSYSVLRSKLVSFNLGLVYEVEYNSAERRGACLRLEAELDERRIRGAKLSGELAEEEPKLAKLRSQLDEVEKTVKRAKERQRENEREMKESQAKLAALRQPPTGKGGGSAGAAVASAQ